MAIDNIDVSTNDHQVVDGTQSSVGVRARDKDVIIQKKPTAGIETLEPVMETMERVNNVKKTPKIRQNGSADAQSQGDASPTKELPKEPVTKVVPKKTGKSQRNGSPASLSQDNVSPTTQAQTINCKLWHVKKSNIVALGRIHNMP